MEFRTRKIVKPQDLNPHGTLFGGRVLEWIDEEAAIYAACQVGSSKLVTKLMSTVNFVASASLGDIIEIGCEVVRFGRTSVTVRCRVRNKESGQLITEVDEIVFVHVDADGRPAPHAVFLKTEGAGTP
jgi:acyl-CoA hydrolase